MGLFSAKAYIEVETGDEIECMFNPSELSFSVGADWGKADKPGLAVPQLEFNAGVSGTM